MRDHLRGQLVYEGLKSRFVDVSKLLVTLERDTHTGYVRLTTIERTSFLLFIDGELVSCAIKVGTDYRPTVVDAFRRDAERGDGLIDVGNLRHSDTRALALSVTGSSTATATLIAVVAAILPRNDRDRWTEEAQADLASITGRWARLCFVWRVIVGMPCLAWVTRHATRMARRR